MRFGRGSIWTDKRLWAALAVSIVFRTVLDRLLTVETGPVLEPPIENPALAPTRPTEGASGPMVDVDRVIRDRQIKRINLRDGSSAEPPMSPEAAAAWIGGLVLFLGGFGAVWLWRRAEQEELEGDELGPQGR